MKTFTGFITIFITVIISRADVINVPGNQPTIQSGIDAAANGDTVLVAEGTYYENLLIEHKAVTLASLFFLDGDTSHISKTTINGSQPNNTDNASVVSFLNSPDSNILCGFTITGGYGTKKVYGNTIARGGGGLVILGSSTDIMNNHIVYNVVDNTTVPDVYHNSQGGGIIFDANGVSGLTLTISENLIADNRTQSAMTGGGAISILLPYKDLVLDYTIEKNIIKNNMIINTDDWKAMGGGIFLEFYLPTMGTQIIRKNIIRNNQALCTTASKHSFGGGMYFIILDTDVQGALDSDPGPFIYNNLICGNHSDYLGGGVAVWRANYTVVNPAIPLTSPGRYTPKPSFLNNTIVDNTASDGAGFYIMNHVPFLMNNILWNIHPDDAEWGEIFLGNEPTWTSWVEPNRYGGVEMHNSIIQGLQWVNFDNGIYHIPPVFSDSLYHVAATNTSIGGGRTSLELNGVIYNAPDDDINGNVRPNSVDAYVDMGAYESEYMAQPRLTCLNLHCNGNYFNPYQISPLITTEVFNPYAENLRVYAHLQQADSAEIVSTTELYDDGAHNDQHAGDQVYGGAFDPFSAETMFNMFLSIENISRGETATFHDDHIYTSIGPVVLDHYTISSADSLPNPGDRLYFNFHLKNEGIQTAAENLTMKVIALDTVAQVRSLLYLKVPDIQPDSVVISARYTITFGNNLSETRPVPFELDIRNDGITFWKDTVYVLVTDLEERLNLLPARFSLFQNYPNPFNPKTVISYKLQVTSNIDISIYNIIGQKVTTLVSEQQPAGSYQVEWDATGFASGVYFFKLSTDQGFAQTRKMVLIR